MKKTKTLPKLQVSSRLVARAPPSPRLPEVHIAVDIPEAWKKKACRAADVHYTLDTLDSLFLKELRRDHALSVCEDDAELVIDRLEKEWFLMQKTVLAETGRAEAAEECNICGENSAVPEDRIVACARCGVAAHQKCYGIPHLVPGRTWLCRPCLVLGSASPQCIACPDAGGLFKRTREHQWIHMTCALWIRTLEISNHNIQEPVDRVREALLSARRGCCLCAKASGIPEACAYAGCIFSAHISCVIAHGMYMDTKNYVFYCGEHDPSRPRELLFVRCDRHYPTLQHAVRRRRHVRLAPRRSTALDALCTLPAFVPEYTINRILMNDISSAHTAEVVAVAKYWIAKRNTWKNPLVATLRIELFPKKRVFLAHRASLADLDLQGILAKISELRAPVQSHALLVAAELDIRRARLRCTEHRLRMAQKAFFGTQTFVAEWIKMLKQHDRHRIFHYPVGPEAPDYYTVIKRPICLRDISAKNRAGTYRCTEDFLRDCRLIVSNAKTYNSTHTVYYEQAVALEKEIDRIASSALCAENRRAVADIYREYIRAVCAQNTHTALSIGTKVVARADGVFYTGSVAHIDDTHLVLETHGQNITLSRNISFLFPFRPAE